MADEKRLKAGDAVSWQSHGGTAHGKVVRKQTADRTARVGTFLVLTRFLTLAAAAATNGTAMAAPTAQVDGLR